MHKVVQGGGEHIMKKILTISTVIVLALTLGVAYAYAYDTTMSSDMSKWDNGITIFAVGSVSDGRDIPRGAEFAGESNLARAEALGLDNGVTLFASKPVDTEVLYKGTEVFSSEECMAAGGYEGDATLDLHNGITAFDRGPIDAN
jgi:hypothetical protein